MVGFRFFVPGQWGIIKDHGDGTVTHFARSRQAVLAVYNDIGTVSTAVDAQWRKRIHIKRVDDLSKM